MQSPDQLRFTPHDRLFEEQFGNTTRFESQYGSATVIHVTPRFPIENPVILMPGFGLGSKQYEQVANVLVTEFNRETLIIDVIRNSLDTSLRSETELRAHIHSGVITERVPGKHVTILPHSRAAITATQVAEQMPQQINKLLLVNAAGTLQDDTFGELSLRYFNSAAESVRRGLQHRRINQSRLEQARATRRYITRHPVRAFQEVRDFVQEDIVPKMQRLQALGVRITFFHAESDSLFPFDVVEARLKAAGIPLVKLMGEHDVLLAKPEDTLRQILGSEIVV